MTLHTPLIISTAMPIFMIWMWLDIELRVSKKKKKKKKKKRKKMKNPEFGWFLVNTFPMYRIA